MPGAKWTMDRKGKKLVAIAGLQDNRQIAAVICSSFVEDFLPPQLIESVKNARIVLVGFQRVVVGF